MIIWLVGMSGSGKTTIGQKLCESLTYFHQKKWFFLDGDLMRAVMQDNLGHTVEDRRKNADRISRLCLWFDQNDINVVACVLSIFPEYQEWNRTHFKAYKQIYVQVDYDVLKKRDNKNLYLKAEKGEIEDVVGVQIPFPTPINNDLVLNNNADHPDFTKMVNQIIQELNLTAATTENLYELSEFNEELFTMRVEKFLEKFPEQISFTNNSWDNLELNKAFLKAEQILNRPKETVSKEDLILLKQLIRKQKS
jgi:adenylylsulfate kinase